MGIDAWGWDAPLHGQAKLAKRVRRRDIFWSAHYVGREDMRILPHGAACEFGIPPTDRFQGVCVSVTCQARFGGTSACSGHDLEQAWDTDKLRSQPSPASPSILGMAKVVQAQRGNEPWFLRTSRSLRVEGRQPLLVARALANATLQPSRCCRLERAYGRNPRLVDASFVKRARC